MSLNRKENLQQRLIRPLLWSILIAMSIYISSVIASDFDAFNTSIKKMSMLGLFMILALSLLNYGLRFARWEIYLYRLHYNIPIFRSLVYYLAGFAFTTTPGKAGETIRSHYLKRHGVSYTNSLAAFFTERFTDLIAMVLLAIMAVVTFPSYQWPVIIITFITLLLLPFIHAKPFHTLIKSRLNRLSSKHVRYLLSHFFNLLDSASNLLRSGPLYYGIIIAVIAWGSEGVAFYVILDELELEVPLPLAIGIYSVSILAGAISFLPGGLGSTEAVMIFLLKLAGSSTSTAIAATLICRFATLWFAVIIGGAIITILELFIKDNSSREADPLI
jgi:uncharacterized protein (TIRG00374 family)